VLETARTLTERDSLGVVVFDVAPRVLIPLGPAPAGTLALERDWRASPNGGTRLAPALEAAVDPSFPQAKLRNMQAALHLAEHMHEAPVHLFVAGWLRRGEPQSQALFPAVQNILLACRAVGLGASLTTVHRAFGAEIDAYLGLPDDRQTCALLPIGWPVGRYGRPPRKSVDACLFWEQFEASRDE